MEIIKQIPLTSDFPLGVATSGVPGDRGMAGDGGLGIHHFGSFLARPCVRSDDSSREDVGLIRQPARTGGSRNCGLHRPLQVQRK